MVTAKGEHGSDATVIDLRGAEFPPLVEAALAGDEAAWRTLVERLSGVVWSVLHTFRMTDSDREDAFASTFYRLYDKLDSVREPRALAGWIATTARNEARAVLRTTQRIEPRDELPLDELSTDDISDGLLRDELTAAALAAFATLPARSQALLRLLTTVPPLSYDEISSLLDLPRGSIGPTRARLLAQLRDALQPYLDGASA